MEHNTKYLSWFVLSPFLLLVGISLEWDSAAAPNLQLRSDWSLVRTLDSATDYLLISQGDAMENYYKPAKVQFHCKTSKLQPCLPHTHTGVKTTPQSVGSDYIKSCSTVIYIVRVSLEDSEKSFKTAHIQWPLMIWSGHLVSLWWKLSIFQEHIRPCKWTLRWTRLLTVLPSHKHISVSKSLSNDAACPQSPNKSNTHCILC